MTIHFSGLDFFNTVTVYMTLTLFCLGALLRRSVPSFATSQKSKATLKAWATVSVTAWAYDKTKDTFSKWDNSQNIFFWWEKKWQQNVYFEGNYSFNYGGAYPILNITYEKCN